jgi:hypothetical protein
VPQSRDPAFSQKAGGRICDIPESGALGVRFFHLVVWSFLHPVYKSFVGGFGAAIFKACDAGRQVEIQGGLCPPL